MTAPRDCRRPDDNISRAFRCGVMVGAGFVLLLWVLAQCAGAEGAAP